MRRLLGGLLLGVLVASVLQAQAPPGPISDILAARADILALAEAAKKGPIPRARFQEFRKKHGDDLLVADTIWKPVKRKGLGYEAKLLKLGGPRMPNRAELFKEKDELERIGYVVFVMANVLQEHPVPGSSRRRPQASIARQWHLSIAFQKEAALEFIQAVRAADPKRVNRTAEKINDACYGCHSLSSYDW